MVAATHFEAKKHAYRQTQDGIVISFVCHPNDVSALLAMAPLGTRFMVAIAELSDDEQASVGAASKLSAPLATPAQQRREETAALNLKGGDANGAGTGSSGPSGADATLPHAEQSATHGAHKPRNWSALPLSEQCALRCGNTQFWAYWRDRYGTKIDSPEHMADRLRDVMQIDSRSELDTDEAAAGEWRLIERRFQTWLTTQQHAEHIR